MFWALPVVELVETNTMDANDPIRSVNPLGKIPALEDGGNIIYDSRVIVEYLDAKAAETSYSCGGCRRFETLTRAADGRHNGCGYLGCV